MSSDFKKSIKELYSDQNIWVKLHVAVRSWILQLTYYAKFLPQGGLLIDVGCGRGVMANYLSLLFPECHVIGIDLDQVKIRDAVKTVGGRRNIEFFIKDVSNWDVPECQGAIMTDFLHHINGHLQISVLHNVYKSLEKGGVLLITEVDSASRPIYKYWAAYLSDRALYPFSRSYFRKVSEWQYILSSIGFSVKTLTISNSVFAIVLFVCQK